MTAQGFPLPPGNWYFSQMHFDSRKYRVEITHNGTIVISVKASTELLVNTRAWEALREYCFRGTKTIRP